MGLTFVVNTLRPCGKVSFTQQTGAIYGVENLEMVRVMGHQYEVVMTVTKILAVAWGLFVGGSFSTPNPGRDAFVPGTCFLALAPSPSGASSS